MMRFASCWSRLNMRPITSKFYIQFLIELTLKGLDSVENPFPRLYFFLFLNDLLQMGEKLAN